MASNGPSSTIVNQVNAEVKDRLRVFMKMVQVVGDSMSYVDSTYRYRAVNPAFMELFGEGRASVIGLQIAEVVGEGLFRVAEPLLKRCFEGEEASFDGWVTVPKIGDRFARIRCFPDVDTNGQVVGAVVVSHDMTRWQASRRAIEETTRLFESVMLQTPVPTLLVSADRVIRLFNKACADYFGFDDQVAPGVNLTQLNMTWSDFGVDGSSITGTARPIFRALSGDTVVAREIRTVTSDGIERWALVTAVPICDNDGNIMAAFVTCPEITEIRSLEQRLHQDDKMRALGQLAGGIAHDFNNQLAGILACADLVKRSGGENGRTARLAEQIITAGQRAADLTTQLLAFSRKGGTRSAPVDLNHLVNEVADIAAHTLDRKIEIVTQVDGAAVMTTGDASQIQNAVMNLVLNSRDAMVDGGQLTLETGRSYLDKLMLRRVLLGHHPGPVGYVRVSDSGQGIDPTMVQQVFEPFFTTKAAGGGTGLGLAAVYGTVESHQGAIDVRSRTGEGTSVTLYFPESGLHSVAPSKNTGSESTAEPVGRARILVVDDEPGVRLATGEILERSGYQVTLAADGREALGAVDRLDGVFDLVILDLVMPQMGGRAVLSALRTLAPDIKVLICSGYSLDEQVQSMLDDGAVGFLQKPFRASRLCELVGVLLQQGEDKA